MELIIETLLALDSMPEPTMPRICFLTQGLISLSHTRLSVAVAPLVVRVGFTLRGASGTLGIFAAFFNQI